jgi:DNA-directed RNA polymerase subunit beta
LDKKFANEFTLIQPPFESATLDMVMEATKYTNTKIRERIFDPISNTYIHNKINVGEMYFFRMTHIADEKLAARGIGAYSRKTLQPLGGKKQLGGQRLGEMETACLIGYDAPFNLEEFFTTKSDCIDAKNKYIKDNIETDLINLPENNKIDKVPESVKLLNAYLTVIGIDNSEDIN